MRIALFLLIITSSLSCQQNLDIQGFWVGVDENGDWNDQTIEVTADSIFIFHHFGLPLKSTYSISGSKIISGITYQLFSNERFSDGGEVEIEISDDTLHWDLSSNPDKYVRSRFNSYVEHYANSKGLNIELPESDTFINSDFHQHKYLDLFVGFDDQDKVSMATNEGTIQDKDLTKWLSESSEAYKTMVLRIFADQSIGIETLDPVQAAVDSSKIHLIQYVSKPKKRELRNLYQNPYSNYFYGQLLRAKRIAIEEKPTTSNNY